MNIDTYFVHAYASWERGINENLNGVFREFIPIGISTPILFPLTFLSNAFVPVETLLDWLKWFAEINPISHLVTSVRDLINYRTISTEFEISLLGAAVVDFIFAPLMVRMYMRRT